MTVPVWKGKPPSINFSTKVRAEHNQLAKLAYYQVRFGSSPTQIDERTRLLPFQ